MFEMTYESAGFVSAIVIFGCAAGSHLKPYEPTRMTGICASGWSRRIVRKSSQMTVAKISISRAEPNLNDPNQGKYRDEEAEALAKPPDAQLVLDAIRAAEKVEDGG